MVLRCSLLEHSLLSATNRTQGHTSTSVQPSTVVHFSIRPNELEMMSRHSSVFVSFLLSLNSAQATLS